MLSSLFLKTDSHCCRKFQGKKYVLARSLALSHAKVYIMYKGSCFREAPLISYCQISKILMSKVTNERLRNWNISCRNKKDGHCKFCDESLAKKELILEIEFHTVQKSKKFQMKL